MNSSVYFLNHIKKFEDDLKSKPKVNLELDLYQMFIIKNSLYNFSKFLRHPNSMDVVIETTINHFLKDKTNEKQFRNGIDNKLNEIWELHDRHYNVLIDLYHSNKTWDEPTIKWFERCLKYFQKTKMEWEEPTENGETRFESKVRYLKKKLNYDNRYSHLKRVYDFKHKDKSTLMSKLKTLF